MGQNISEFSEQGLEQIQNDEVNIPQNNNDQNNLDLE